MGATAAPLARAQTRVHRVAFLGVGRSPAYAYRIDALRQGLRDHGYVEGKDLVLEFSWAEGEYARLPQLAIAVVRSKPDVIVTHTTPGVRAVQAASKTVPIVMTDTFDAVRAGLVESLARPGGNVTGSTLLGFELNAKRLEMLKEVLPGMSRAAVLMNPDAPTYVIIRDEMRGVGKERNVEMHTFDARRPADFEAAFQAMSAHRVDAVMVVEDPLFTVNTRSIAALALKHRMPLAGFSEFAESGGLIGYGVNFPELYRRAAYFVHRILRGAKPADLPVEQATKFDLVVNATTAKTLAITIPQTLLLRTDRVVD